MGLEDILGKYIITSAEYGANVHHKQLDALERYAKRSGAELCVIPIEGQYKEEKLHDRLQEYILPSGNTKLGKNVGIGDFNIKAQQINPLTGLRRFSQYEQSLIVGSTKQQMQVTATSPSKLPRIILSTGAVTLPNYKNNRIGLIGQNDHVQGAVFLNTRDDGRFHVRQFESISDGSFIDLGMKYSSKGKPTRVRADTVVWGDLHNHQLDDLGYKFAINSTKELKPKNLFLHDVFDGYSISHHDSGKQILKHFKFTRGETNLYNELSELGSRLTQISKLADTVYIVKSNHDEVLDRYIEEGRYGTDPQNLYVSSTIATAMMDGKDPLETGIKTTYGKLPRNIKFMSRDSDLSRYGYQLGFHGDKGVSGSRGSVNGFEYSIGKGVIGHSHTPQRLRNMYQVGTLCDLHPDYAKGTPSSWLASNVVIYPNGKAQHIHGIEGEYK